jgi:translation initiation factor IF-3
MDYNRFKYEAAQRAKESRRKSTTSQIKEMKYRPKIGPGDFDTKTRAVEKFLKEGHKVKITIMFRGREVAHAELGMKILDRIAEHCADFSKLEAIPRLDGRNMTMVLAPDKRAAQSRSAKGDSQPSASTPPAASVEPEAKATPTEPSTPTPVATDDTAATAG